MVGKMKGAGIDLRLFHVGTCLYKIYVPFVEIFFLLSIKRRLVNLLHLSEDRSDAVCRVV